VTYSTTNEDEAVNMNDADFWEKVLPEYQTAKSLRKKLDSAEAGGNKILSTPEERKEFLADIEKIINELKESLAARSSSYMYSNCNPLSEVTELLKKVEHNTALFSVEDIGKAMALREGLSSKRTRKTVQRTGQEVNPDGEEDAPTERRANREQARPVRQETAEERKDKLSGAWSKAQVNNTRMHMLQYGLHRWDTMPTSQWRARHVDQVKALCECMVQQCLSGAEEGKEMYSAFLKKAIRAAEAELNTVETEAASASEGKGDPGKWANVGMSPAEGYKFSSYLPGQLVKVKVTIKDDDREKSAAIRKYLVVSLEEDHAARKEKGGDMRVYPIQTKKAEGDEKKKEGEEDTKKADGESSSSSSASNAEEHLVRVYLPGFVGRYSVRCIYFAADGKMKEMTLAGDDLNFNVECHPHISEEKFKEMITRSQKSWINRLG